METPCHESDLIRRCLEGSDEAWENFFEEHYDPALRFVFQISASISHEDAEEIVQEAFSTVVRSLPGFRGGSSIRTWLLRIAANCAHDFLDRRNAAKRGGGLATLSLTATESCGIGIDPPTNESSPDAALSQHDEFEQIRRAVGQLGRACREVIELRFFGDLSYQEVAAALRLNPKTVSSRLSRCLRELAAHPIFLDAARAISRHFASNQNGH